MSSKEFQVIMERLDRIERMLKPDEAILTVKDISMTLGVSEGYLRGDGRRFLPNGKSEFPGRKMRWRKSTFEAWRKEKGF